MAQKCQTELLQNRISSFVDLLVKNDTMRFNFNKDNKNEFF